MKRFPLVLSLLAGLAFASYPAFADSIVLESASGGVYSYGIEVDPGSSYNFYQDETIALTGLSGVTGLTNLFSAGGFTGVFTPDSVTVTESLFSSSLFNNTTASPFTFLLFSIVSTTTTGSPVDLAYGNVVTTIEGPGGAVIPEPSTWLLFGTGLLCVAELARRRGLLVPALTQS